MAISCHMPVISTDGTNLEEGGFEIKGKTLFYKYLGPSYHPCPNPGERSLDWARGLLWCLKGNSPLVQAQHCFASESHVWILTRGKKQIPEESKPNTKLNMRASTGRVNLPVTWNVQSLLGLGTVWNRINLLPSSSYPTQERQKTNACFRIGTEIFREK